MRRLHFLGEPRLQGLKTSRLDPGSPAKAAVGRVGDDLPMGNFGSTGEFPATVGGLL